MKGVNGLLTTLKTTLNVESLQENVECKIRGERFVLLGYCVPV
jgi:hypothetical protein